MQAFRWPEIRTRTRVTGVVTVVDGEALAQGSVVGDPAAIEAQRLADPSLDHLSAIEDLFDDQLVAADLVTHFLKRLEAMDGKAMIVCMSRRICVDLYNALIQLRPEWAQDTLKVVMTGSAADGPDWQPHIRSKDARRKLANRFKVPADPFQIVIVRDMWLTGFDAPCLHTMYADKPMQGHGLMQAIARVNRVFRDKPGGLVVDYLGLADQLKRALGDYTEGGGKGDPTFDTAQAIAVMLEKHDIACDLMHGFDWSHWSTGTPSQRLQLLPAGQEHILQPLPCLRPLLRQRRGHRDPRRREFLPGAAGRSLQANLQHQQNARADRCRHSPVGEQGHHHRWPGHRCVYRRRSAQARYLDSQ